MLPLELVQILACTVCKGEVTLSEDGASLHCKRCSAEYPVVDGVPVMLTEQTHTTS